MISPYLAWGLKNGGAGLIFRTWTWDKKELK